MNMEPHETVSASSRWVYLAASICVSTILALAWSTQASDVELDTDIRVFPYKGSLRLNGAGFTGNADFQVRVTNNGDCNFAEEHTDIQVFGGTFGLEVGAVQGAGVDDCIFDAEAVYIEIDVRNSESDGAYTTLLGQQRIFPVPFAFWTAEGSDLKVDGDLTIVGDASVDPLGVVSFDNTMNVSGDLRSTNTANLHVNNTQVSIGPELNNPWRHNGNTLSFSNPSNVEFQGPLRIVGGGDVDSDWNIGGGMRATRGSVSFRSDVQLNSSADVNANNNGVLTVGEATGERVSWDGDELQSWDSNGNPDVFQFNPAGGTVELGGTLTVNGNLTVNDPGFTVHRGFEQVTGTQNSRTVNITGIGSNGGTRAICQGSARYDDEVVDGTTCAAYYDSGWKLFLKEGSVLSSPYHCVWECLVW